MFGRAKGRGRRGFTLVELMVSTAVLAVLLEALVGGSLAMTRSAQFGDKRNRLAQKVSLALDKMSAELNLSSTDIDAVTGAPYMTSGGVEYDMTLTFKRVVSFGDSAGELAPIWSSDITYALDKGQVTRTQDGVTTTIVSGATQLDFEIEASGRVVITLAATADPDGVAPDTLVETMSVPTSF